MTSPPPEFPDPLREAVIGAASAAVGAAYLAATGAQITTMLRTRRADQAAAALNARRPGGPPRPGEGRPRPGSGPGGNRPGAGGGPGGDRLTLRRLAAQQAARRQDDAARIVRDVLDDATATVVVQDKSFGALATRLLEQRAAPPDAVLREAANLFRGLRDDQIQSAAQILHARIGWLTDPDNPRIPPYWREEVRAAAERLRGLTDDRVVDGEIIDAEVVNETGTPARPGARPPRPSANTGPTEANPSRGDAATLRRLAQRRDQAVAARAVGALFDADAARAITRERSWPALATALCRDRGPLTPDDVLRAARDLGPLTGVRSASQILTARVRWLDNPEAAPAGRRAAVDRARQRLAQASQARSAPPASTDTTVRQEPAGPPGPGVPAGPGPGPVMDPDALAAAEQLVRGELDAELATAVLSDQAFPTLAAALLRPRPDMTPAESMGYAADRAWIALEEGDQRPCRALLDGLASLDRFDSDAAAAATAIAAAFPEPASPGQPPAEPPSLAPETGGPTPGLTLGPAPGPAPSA